MKSVIEFLKEPKNSVIRETIFKYGFFHVLKLAACSLNQHLKIYEQEVDNEGCDVIIEDQSNHSRKVQLKSILKSSTNYWDIHRNVLLPGFSQMGDYGFDTMLGPTSPGAIIIVEANFEGTEIKNYNFYYTDINIISLISIDSTIIPQKKCSDSKNANEILRQLPDFSKRKIKVRKGMFIKTDALGLIKLMGFCRHYQFNNSSKAFIRNNKNRGKFFRELPDYNPYEISDEIITSWNSKLNDDTAMHRNSITSQLASIIKS